MYDYITPAGFGDTFYIYTVNGEDIPLTNGGSATLVGIVVDDGMFVCRVWSGASELLATAGTIQVYDGVKCAWFQLPVLQSGIMPSGMAVLPEKVYRVNSVIRFDLANVELAVNSNGTANVYADQMAFIGARRVSNGPSDPLPSLYQYYEKPFSYPFTFQLTNYGPSSVSGAAIPGLAAPTQYSILIQDFDFELRRILVTSQASGSGGPAVFFNETGQALQVASVGGVSGTVNLNSAIPPTTPNLPLVVTVVGHVINVQYATNGGGFWISTVDQVVAAINAAAGAFAFATKLLPGSISGLPDSPASANFGPGTATMSPYASPFKIMLYDATWRQRMSVPVLSELLCTNLSTVPPVSMSPNNAWPCPPMMYPVNSVIRFDIFSLIPTGDTLPTTVTLLFDGVRRIAC